MKKVNGQHTHNAFTWNAQPITSSKTVDTSRSRILHWVDTVICRSIITLQHCRQSSIYFGQSHAGSWWSKRLRSERYVVGSALFTTVVVTSAFWRCMRPKSPMNRFKKARMSVDVKEQGRRSSRQLWCGTSVDTPSSWSINIGNSRMNEARKKHITFKWHVTNETIFFLIVCLFIFHVSHILCSFKHFR